MQVRTAESCAAAVWGIVQNEVSGHMNLFIRTANIPLFYESHLHFLVTLQCYNLSSCLHATLYVSLYRAMCLHAAWPGYPGKCPFARARRPNVAITLCSHVQHLRTHWMWQELYKAEAFKQMRLKVIPCWSLAASRICSPNQVLTRTSWRGCAQRERLMHDAHPSKLARVAQLRVLLLAARSRMRGASRG